MGDYDLDKLGREGGKRLCVVRAIGDNGLSRPYLSCRLLFSLMNFNKMVIAFFLLLHFKVSKGKFSFLFSVSDLTMVRRGQDYIL